MYLKQMGDIPLLTRSRELFLAKSVEVSRTLLRNAIFQSDIALHKAAELVQKVSEGALVFVKTMRTSETDNLVKGDIVRRIDPNLKTFNHLREKNTGDLRGVERRHKAALSGSRQSYI